MQFGFALVTEIVMTTESIAKPRNSIFELVLRLLYQSVLQIPVYKANPQ